MKIKFLIVEDDYFSRLIIEKVLTKKFDCQLFFAKNGLQALSILDEEQPDIILLDIAMPEMDGIEMLRVIRKSKKFTDLPVIIISAVGDKSSINKTLPLKISDYILKPINFNDTVKRIKEVVDKNTLRQKDIFKDLFHQKNHAFVHRGNDGSEIKINLYSHELDKELKVFLN